MNAVRFLFKCSHIPPTAFQTGQCPQLLLLWEKLYKKKKKRIRKMKNLGDVMAGAVVRYKVLKADGSFTFRTPFCSAFS